MSTSRTRIRVAGPNIGAVVARVAAVPAVAVVVRVRAAEARAVAVTHREPAPARHRTRRTAPISPHSILVLPAPTLPHRATLRTTHLVTPTVADIRVVVIADVAASAAAHRKARAAIELSRALVNVAARTPASKITAVAAVVKARAVAARVAAAAVLAAVAAGVDAAASREARAAAVVPRAAMAAAAAAAAAFRG